MQPKRPALITATAGEIFVVGQQDGQLLILKLTAQ